MTTLAHLIGHMLSCKDASRMLSQLQDGELSRFKRWRLKLHLAACDGCTAFAAQLRFLRAAMRAYRE